MKYVPRELNEAAENSSGGGGRGMLKEILSLSGLLLLALLLIYLLVAWFTDVSIAQLSPEREAALFAGLGADYTETAVPEQLTEHWQQAQATFKRLQTYEGVVPLDYRLAFSDESQPNAYAMPGGVIVLTAGLLEALDEKIALAFVLAHELGHFAQRHHLKRLGRQIGFAAGVRLLTGGSHQSLWESGTELLALNYSRRQEAEADTFAIQCLDAIYAETQGAEKLFELLEDKSGIPTWAYMFMTHPDNKTRIRSIRAGADAEELE